MAVMGCGTVKLGNYIPEPTRIKSYTLNVSQSASVGDPIFRVQNARMIPVYRAIQDYQPPDAGVTNAQPMILKGETFDVVAIDQETGDLIIRDSAKYLNGIAINRDGHVTKGWVGVVANLRGNLPPGGAFAKEKLFEALPEGHVDRGSFKAEMIYSGLTGRTLKAVYREYVDDYMRPSFSTELQYNLDESKILAYKSIRIEITNATNSSVQYRVLSDDDLPWLPN